MFFPIGDNYYSYVSYPADIVSIISTRQIILDMIVAVLWLFSMRAVTLCRFNLYWYDLLYISHCVLRHIVSRGFLSNVGGGCDATSRHVTVVDKVWPPELFLANSIDVVLWPRGS